MANRLDEAKDELARVAIYFARGRAALDELRAACIAFEAVWHRDGERTLFAERLPLMDSQLVPINPKKRYR